MNNNNKKHPKWSADWENATKIIVGKEVEIEVEKHYKKGETKPDGTIVSADAGETIKSKEKKNNFEHLLNEIKAQKKVVEDVLDDLAEKRGYKDEAKQIFRMIKMLEPKIKDWESFTTWYNGCHARFLVGGTNGYGVVNTDGTTGNKGWVKTFKNYLEKQYSLGGTLTDYDNLYKGKFQVQDTNGTQTIDFKLTENEVVKLVARVVHELGKIDKTKFDTFVDSTSTTLPSITGLTTYTKTDLKTWLGNIQKIAKKLVDNRIKTDDHPDKGKPANGLRVEYDFGDDYTKYSKDLSDNTPHTTDNFTDAELTEFFDLIRVLSDSSFTNHADLADAISGVADEENLILLPAQDKPLTEAEFKKIYGDGGVNNIHPAGYKVVNGNTNFYITDYGTKIIKDVEHRGHHYRKVEFNYENKLEIPLKGGLYGWSWLINSFVCENYSDEKNRKKLISSFTDDPIRQLFDDMRSFGVGSDTATTKGGAGTNTTPNYDCFTDAANTFSYQQFPDFYVDEELRLHALKAEKKGLVDEVKTGRKDLIEAERKYDEERQKLFNKEAEVDKLITDKVVELRTELKTKYKFDDTTAPNFGTGTDVNDANRITELEHSSIQHTISNIRYLVGCDKDKPTDKVNENSAYDKSVEILAKVRNDCPGVGYWIHIAVTTDNLHPTVEQKIETIKTDKDGTFKLLGGLEHFWSSFVEAEKLVKLTDWQVEAKNKLKEAKDKQTPTETMNDWRNNLKKYEASLGTALTDEIIKKWQAKKDGQDAFNNLTAFENLIKKVIMMKKEKQKQADGTEKEVDVFDKVNPDFLTWLTGKESTLKTLTDLISKKEPKDIILWIHLWEYSKLEDSKKKARWLKFAWSELGGKQKVDSKDSLTDDEKKKFEDEYLYQVAIGKISESSLTKPTDSNDKNNNGGDNKKPFFKRPLGITLIVLGSVLAVGLLAAVIFWDSLKKWWGGDNVEDGDEEAKKAEEV